MIVRDFAALAFRSPAMLMTVFIARFATDVFDFLLAIISAGISGIGAFMSQLIFFALILWIPEGLAIHSLRKQCHAESKGGFYA